MDNPRETGNIWVHKAQDEDKQVQINVRENRRVQSRMDNPRETGNIWVHKAQDEDKQAQRLEKAKGGIRNGQSKKHWATLGTQDTGRRQTSTNVRESEGWNQEWTIPETLATLGTQETGRR